MIRFPRRSVPVFALLLACAGDPTGLGMPHAFAQSEGKAEVVRPEMGKLLQAAQNLMKAQRYKEALAKVREADALASKSAYESYVLDRMRASAAAGAGDAATTAGSLESVMASGRLPLAETQGIVQTLANTHFRAKDYASAAKWATRYFAEGGNDPRMRELLIHAHYLGNDFANAASALETAVVAKEKAGEPIPEEQLQLLANTYSKQNNGAGYLWVLEKLVTYHPKKQYWADLLLRVQVKPTFSDSLTLDLFRLKEATGTLEGAPDYMEMAQLALNAGLLAEARKIVEEGYRTGALGKGAEAGRHQRLKDLIAKRAAEDEKDRAQKLQPEAAAAASHDGVALVDVGMAYVTSGQFDKGIALIMQGIQKGVLRVPDHAKLHLGIAYYLAGRSQEAVKAFKTVTGLGAADLARLWAIKAAEGATQLSRSASVRIAPVIDSKSCVTPEYPSASRRLEEEGEVTLSLLVNVDGTVAESKVDKSSGFRRLDEAARKALGLCHFKPGTVDGKPEQSWHTLRYVWKFSR